MKDEVLEKYKVEEDKRSPHKGRGSESSKELRDVNIEKWSEDCQATILLGSGNMQCGTPPKHARGR